MTECTYSVSKREPGKRLAIVQDESEELKYEAMPLFKCWLPEGRKYYD